MDKTSVPLIVHIFLLGFVCDPIVYLTEAGPVAQYFNSNLLILRNSGVDIGKGKIICTIKINHNKLAIDTWVTVVMFSLQRRYELLYTCAVYLNKYILPV